MTIDKGDFVCMWRTGTRTEWWCEVMTILPMRAGFNDGENIDQQYQVRYWITEKDRWGFFNLAPDSYHMRMVKEVRKIPPEVAPMFRDLFMRGVKHD
jgi:hypothetical protein